MATNIWTADRRLYLDKDSAVVEANDPTRRTLLVPVGGTLPLAQAEALGLLVAAADAPSDAPTSSPTKRTPANKAKLGPAETK